MTHFRIIAGLGNPGSRYEGTRHNVGFMALDRLASLPFGCEGRPRVGWRDRFGCAIAEIRLKDHDICLVKPLSFMNRSGEPLAEVLRYFKLSIEELVVVHDDIDLPLGTVRVKKGGGDAGHNGLKSVSASIGREFVRLRLGIGRPGETGELSAAEQGGTDFRPAVSEWVLGKFMQAETPMLNEVLDCAVNAIAELCISGLVVSQNKFNS